MRKRTSQRNSSARDRSSTRPITRSRQKLDDKEEIDHIQVEDDLYLHEASDEVERDEGVNFFGKHWKAPAGAGTDRGELKGSQVYNFQDKPKSVSMLSKGVKIPKRYQGSAYFDAQTSVALTSDRTLSRLKTPKLSQAMIDELLRKEPLQFKEQIDILLNDYRSMFGKWLQYLKQDFNLVLFGFGSKKSLLLEFHQSHLTSEDCVVVNGFFPSVTVKQILTSITEDILEIATSFPSITEHAQFIYDAMNTRQDHLYLLVNNIDGPCLRNFKSQDVFAKLASHPKVHLISSIDHINAPLIWDQEKLTKFNFVWKDCTTYLPYREETRYENSFMVTRFEGLELSSLFYVFNSLNESAKEIFVKIVQHQIAVNNNNNAEISDMFTYYGISFHELYKKCRESFLVNSDVSLKAQLSEYIDHKLIIKKRIDGVDCFSIPLKMASLMEFLESRGQAGNIFQ